MAERKGWRDVPTKNLVKGAWSLAPWHVKALRAEAMKRAVARGSGKPDASEVLRELLDRALPREVEIEVIYPDRKPRTISIEKVPYRKPRRRK